MFSILIDIQKFELANRTAACSRMLLCTYNDVMMMSFWCSPEDVQSLVTGKLALKYTGVQIEAIQNIAKASQNRSIAEFQKVWCCVVGVCGSDMWVWSMLDGDRATGTCAGRPNS